MSQPLPPRGTFTASNPLDRILTQLRVQLASGRNDLMLLRRDLQHLILKYETLELALQQTGRLSSDDLLGANRTLQARIRDDLAAQASPRDPSPSESKEGTSDGSHSGDR